MPASDELAGFIRGHFHSVWSLELLLHLKNHRDQPWTNAALVQALRASGAVVTTGVAALFAGGLIVVDNEGSARFSPATEDLARLAEEVAELYAKRPGAVRRLIVQSAGSGLTAFADAFRLRKD